jgi:hypothetical protein
MQLPPEALIPQEPMFLDVYTFAVTKEQIQTNKCLSRHNAFDGIDYRISFQSWSRDRYRVALEGRYENLKFSGISADASADKTKIVRIKYSANRTLYIALTPLEEENQASRGVLPPKAVLRPLPAHPPGLSGIKREGKVRIRVVIDREGRVDREKLVLLECPCYLFARNSLDVILNQWTFEPGTKDGAAASVAANIEFRFGRFGIAAR